MWFCSFFANEFAVTGANEFANTFNNGILIIKQRYLLPIFATKMLDEVSYLLD